MPAPVAATITSVFKKVLGENHQSVVEVIIETLRERGSTTLGLFLFSFVLDFHLLRL
jgi:hypothetical protein